jgi:hypothetical protein
MPEQELNALFPMLFTPCGSTTEEREKQESNALLPMLVTPCGSTTEERE